MTQNLKFHVTENRLATNADIKYLSAQNDIYQVTTFYYGDYNADKAANAISKNLTLVDCKSDGLHPAVKYINGQIYIAITEGELLYAHRVDEYKKWLDDAKESAMTLAELLREYQFPATV